MELSKSNSTKKRILCVWLPDWPVLRQTLDRETQFNRCGSQPYRSQAIVLHERVRGSKRVAACSARARELGVTVGMTLSEAAALLGKGRYEWAHDPRADRESLERLGVWCHRYSPLVGLDDAAQPDSLLLDVTGVARFFGGEEALVQRIVAQFARRDIVVRIGLTGTVGAAWAAARIAKAESGAKAECGWRIVAEEEENEFLRALPLVGLRLPEDVLDLLGQLGLRWVGELERLPRADFNSRFGPELLRRWDQAAGRIEEPIMALPLPEKFEAEQFFEHPVGDRATLEFVLKQLVERVARMAAMAGRGALRVEVRFDCRTSGNLGFDVGLFRPSSSAEHLCGLVAMRLERLRLPGRVETLNVSLPETAALEKQQGELFELGTASQRDRQTANLIDRLASRLGRERILGVRLLAEAQPERAWRYESLVDRRQGGSRRSSSRNLPPRPVQLLRRPLRLKAVSIVPDGPPLHFTLSGERQTVAEAWGPERIQTGWWRGQAIGRDYYRVETTDGGRYWVFRRRRDGRWFLHGVFN